MMRAVSTPRLFPFRFDPSLVPIAALLGITPATAHVVVELERLEARFGPWCVRTHLDNIIDVCRTGSYRPWKALGPPRYSLADGGLTFATSVEQGVCLRFRRPVRGIEPFGRIRHPGLTVTVQDVAGLIDTVSEHHDLLPR